MQNLKTQIESIADQPYRHIRKLNGSYKFPGFDFRFIRIQGSPGANPASIAEITVPVKATGFPDLFMAKSIYRIAMADFIIRRFKLGIDRIAKQNRGRDGSGSFYTIEFSQKMLQRDCILFVDNDIELRFIFSLPAKGSGGGQFDAGQAWLMFEKELTAMVDFALYYKNYDQASRQLLDRYLDVQHKREQIKNYLQKNGLTVFINNGAILPRQSGIDDRPAIGKNIVPFQSPMSCQVDIPISDTEVIQGMAIKEGITCITGGGYHGKSTLLQAIIAGVYAHIPDDGREYIVTREDAVFIRAEEGRSIRNVYISAFIGMLPNGMNTEQFSTDNASGSTSQAAMIVESLEAGSNLLLFDEDSCATNLMLRDELIAKVMSSTQEPIKPLYNSLRSLWCQYHVSMIFVVGGLGRFLQKADTCLLMDNYQCQDITAKVREELGEIKNEIQHKIKFSSQRYLASDNFDPAYINQRLNKQIPKRIKSLRNAPRQLEYGMDLINLEALPQLIEASQILAIGYCLLRLKKAMEHQGSKTHTIKYWLDWLYQQLERHGLCFLQPEYPGLLSLPRRNEVAAAINRTRSLKVQVEP